MTKKLATDAEGHYLTSDEEQGKVNLEYQAREACRILADALKVLRHECVLLDKTLTRLRIVAGKKEEERG